MSAAAHSPELSVVSGLGLAIRGNDVDTDQIMPARFLKWITFAGLGQHIFADARAEALAAGVAHPIDTITDGAPRIVFVNQNFGCGSSREHAPQGMKRAGIIGVVGESFGEIFAGNCLAIGVPCVEVVGEVARQLQRLVENEPLAQVKLDLGTLTVQVGTSVFPVTIREGRRRQLMEGTWDSTAVLLEAAINVDEVLDRD